MPRDCDGKIFWPSVLVNTGIVITGALLVGMILNIAYQSHHP